MVFLSKNRKNSKGKYLLLSLFLVIIFYLGGLFFLTKFSHYAGKPIWWLRNSSTELLSDFSMVIKTKKTLLKENEELKIKLDQINSQYLFYKSLLKENEELKEMLGRQKESPHQFILANVLSKPNLSPYGSLILDIGENYNLKKGDKVVVNEKVLIGEIEKVYSKTATVRLYSFPNENLNVAVGFDKIIGIAQGKGSGNFEIKFPKDLLFEKEDLITLPDSDLFFLGVVDKIIITPEDPFQTILFKIPVNIFELRWVQILQES